MDQVLQRIKDDATAIFKAGLKAIAPNAAINRFCHRHGDMLTINNQSFNLKAYEHIYLVGAGKATAPMAASMEDILGDRLNFGVIIVKYGHTVPLKKVRTMEAGHPVPDQNGEAGTQKILEMAKRTSENDLCICLLSGGGSALLPKPVAGISLTDKQKMTHILLACGATIHEINTLRKHISLIKGGQLAAAAAPGTMVSIILSDVVGDDLDVIASGPTVPDRTTFTDCMAIVTKYNIADRLPKTILDYFTRGATGKMPETPKPNDPVFIKTHNFIVGSNIDALAAARKEAIKRQYKTLILSSMIEGETSDAARIHTAIAKEIIKTGNPLQTPACILSGGETTVTLKGNGLGGRNQEFALCAAADISGKRHVVVLSAGTDGNDGPTDAAGAIVDNTTLDRAAAVNMDIKAFLENNDAYHFFAGLGDLLITGPTNTNVMDIHIMLIL